MRRSAGKSINCMKAWSMCLLTAVTIATISANGSNGRRRDNGLAVGFCVRKIAAIRRKRPGKRSPPLGTALSRLQCEHRRGRRAFLESRTGRKLYARRGQTVEPFNDWLKSLFELDEKVWHRGLENNRTQISTAIFAYQLLLRYNRRCGNHNGQVKWILDTL